MTDPLALWHAEHLNFARLLDLLEKEVVAFHETGKPNYDLMIDIVYYLRNFGDRLHHPREDVAFACLVERDPQLQPVVNRLLQEHAVIAAAGDELLERLDNIVEDVITPRAAVEAAAATYLVYYRHHLAKEEREVIPDAAQLLTKKDWAAVAVAVPGGPDPLFGDNVEERFRELRKQIAIEARMQR
jgi:hemerythrin-like domain-containing protein